MSAIAARAKTSTMTVSLALRQHPSIPESTRERILKIARELNYRPDPLLGALQAYKKKGKKTSFQGTVAWVHAYPGEHDVDSVPAFNAYYQGASSRAKDLGYAIEKFWLHAPGMTPARLSEVLWNRNITGMLLPPQPQSHASLDMDWSRFSAVSFGYTLQTPQFHMVANHHFRSMALVVQQIRKRGYRRLGLALSSSTGERVEKNWLGAFLAEQQYFPKKEILPPLLFAKAVYRKELSQWLKKYQPDVVLGIDPSVMETICSFGYKIPQDIAFAICGDSFSNLTCARINENSQLIGESAMDFLASMLHRNERGIPRHPIRILIDGGWIEGDTAPPLK